MSPHMGVKCLHVTTNSSKCLHTVNISHVSKQIFMIQTFKTCVFGEANFQLANFHNINFQSGVEWSGVENFQFANSKVKQTSNLHSHDSQCLQACHMAVNVFMHTTWCQMSPYISHGCQCLHACHMVSNVSTHITWW